MKRIFSIIALILVVIMLISLMTSVFFPRANADNSVQAMQEQIYDLEKKKDQLEKELNVIKEQKEKELDKKDILDQQINTTREEMNILSNMLSKLESQIAVSEEQLNTAQAQLEKSEKISKERIRAAYERGSASYWQIILTSKNLHDFVAKAEIIRQITLYDREVINELKAAKEKIESAKLALEEDKQSQESTYSQLTQKKKSLESKQNASNALIDSFNTQSEAAKRAYEKAEAAEQSLRDEIAKKLAESTTSVVDTGDFRYPLDSKWRIITSKFGSRVHPITGTYKMHTGIDISGSGIRGANIYASKSGTVIKAGYNTGYGNYVLINHGNNYATLYAHMERMTVSVGMIVTRGDVIGYVGSTGYSTGPHLHFEIIHNGEYKNPADYFKGIIDFIYQ